MRKMALGVVVLVILVLSAWQLLKIGNFREQLSVAEASSKIQELYKGEIIQITEHPKIYEMTFQNDKGTYEVEINRKTGEVQRLSRINKQTTSRNEQDNPNGNSGQSSPKPSGEQESNEKGKIITEEEAVTIALSSVSGDVDDIHFEESGDGAYYLVKIEKENGEEGTVQIHAITGEVMSISWDD